MICKKILYVHITKIFKDFHLTSLATLPCESRKFKDVTDFDSIRNKLWHVPGDNLRTWFNI